MKQIVLKHNDSEDESKHYNVLKAAICAGLYPNIVKVKLPQKRYQKLVVHLKRFKAKKLNFIRVVVIVIIPVTITAPTTKITTRYPLIILLPIMVFLTSCMFERIEIVSRTIVGLLSKSTNIESISA